VATRPERTACSRAEIWKSDSQRNEQKFHPSVILQKNVKRVTSSPLSAVANAISKKRERNLIQNYRFNFLFKMLVSEVMEKNEFMSANMDGKADPPPPGSSPRPLYLTG
jgi:hypothetical protein